MLKVRELLEQKLKQKGIFDSVHIGPAGSKNAGLKKAKRCILFIARCKVVLPFPSVVTICFH